MLSSSRKKPLGIYVHVPFCVSKCHYCDFISAPADEEYQKKYKDALIKHIKNWVDENKNTLKQYRVESVFFGGGTPSVLNPVWIEQIIETLKYSVDIAENAEITIECNPGTVSPAKLAIYKKNGINRLSFGLQTPEDRLLKIIGRIHNWEEFKLGMNMARAEGFDNINIDMMSALPGQTYEGYIKGLKRVLELNPEHISSYSLILEEGTRLYDNIEKYPPIPDEDTDRKMYHATKEVLEAAGYSRYEISNYSKIGRECRHNLSYWERTDYVGFGVGAASLFMHERFSAIRSVEEYISYVNEGKEVFTEKEELSIADEMSEFMFLGLRKIKGISFSEFEKTFGKSCIDIYGDEIKESVKEGLMIVESDNCRLTERGIDISNYVLSKFV